MPGDDWSALYPPQVTQFHWWLVLAGLVLLGLAILISAVVLLRYRPAPPPVPVTVADLRAKALLEVESVRDRHAQGELPAAAAAQELGRSVRRFVGQASDGEADFATADQLTVAAVSDHRLAPVARFSRAVAASGFARDGDVDAELLAEQAAEVISAWL